MNQTIDPDAVEIIEEDADSMQALLGREADAILLEDGLRPRRLRRAVREDAALARDWSRARAARLRGAIVAEPVRASFYALGLGLLTGLLIAR